ncbi:MAG: TolB protein [Thermoleophilaceae bacterium]|jgi:Tol biopolymer transport system component|nr:TolB protein [Thermoleophilaceae bacterium]
MVRPALVAVLVALALALGAQPADATFPGRNGALVFLSDYGHGFTEAYVGFAGLGGARHDEVFACSGMYSGADYCLYAGWPAVSPDGTRAALLTDDGAPSGSGWAARSSLRILGLSDGSRRVVPVSSPAGVRAYHDRPDVTWSPDGKALLAAQDGGLYRIDLDGIEQGLVVSNASEPDWAADGRIAFVRGRNIYVGPPEGPFRQLTSRGGWAPSWSPHAGWIAFSRGHGVWAVRSSGGKAKRVVRSGPAHRYIGFQGPAWSPDGKLIGYYRERGGDVYLSTVGWRTGRVRRITDKLSSWEAGLSVSPFAWQSLPR